MKKSDLKNYIKENIISILSEATEEEVKAQQELNKELEKTISLKKDAGIEEAERAADRYNVNVFGYQTQYYRVCPAAKAFMDKVVAGGYGDMSDRKNEVIRMAKLNDLLFKMELRAVKDADYAKKIVTSGEVEYIADTIKDMAENLGIPKADVDYVDNHVEIIFDAQSGIKENMNEGHGLDQGDVDFLQSFIDRMGYDKEPVDAKEFTKLKKILKFIIKSNILQDKTKDLSKGKVNEQYDEDDIDMAVNDLRNAADEIEAAGDNAREIVRQYFPNELSRLDAYGAFSNVYSSNRYDVTLGRFIDRLEEEGYEIEDGVAYVNENIGIDLGDYNEDLEKVIDRGIKRINVGSSDEEDVLYYVHNNWMAGNISAEEAMKKISKYLKP